MNRLLIVVFLTLTTSLFAQSNNEKSNFGRLNLGLHGIELSYEYPLTSKLIWENSFGIGMGSNINNNIEYHFEVTKPTPYFKSEIKYIYNQQKRLSKGNKISHNSGNYVGLQSKYSFGNSKKGSLNQTLLTEVHWGIQRSLGRKFLFNTHIGLGYLQDFDTEVGRISPTLGLRFGYILF